MKWTVTKAAQEFGVSRETLRKRLTVAEIPKSETYSTKEICRAVFGDIESERLRLVREQADKVALENAEARRELVPAKEFLEVAQRGLSAMVAAVEAETTLEREGKNKIIQKLRDCGSALARVSDSGDTAAGPDSQ